MNKKWNRGIEAKVKRTVMYALAMMPLANTLTVFSGLCSSVDALARSGQSVQKRGHGTLP